MPRTKSKPRLPSRVPIKIDYILAVIAVILIIYGLAGLLIKPSIEPQPLEAGEPEEPKAAIVDGLSLDYPNETIINILRDRLEQAGYEVTVYSGDQLTVDFMGSILCSSYDIVIMRIHGGELRDDKGRPLGMVALFTNEPYEPGKYRDLQARGLVGKGIPVLSPDKEVFVVTPLYVESLECDETPQVIIVASCYSMDGTSMARALIEKGVKAYIGWNGLVYANVNDAALEILIDRLVTGASISEAVLATYGLSENTQLLYYPTQSGQLTLEDIKP